MDLGGEHLLDAGPGLLEVGPLDRPEVAAQRRLDPIAERDQGGAGEGDGVQRADRAVDGVARDTETVFGRLANG